MLAKPGAIPALGEYWFTDNSGGLFFPVYLSRDYPVKPRELSQRPLTPSALHCGVKRGWSVFHFSVLVSEMHTCTHAIWSPKPADRNQQEEHKIATATKRYIRQYNYRFWLWMAKLFFFFFLTVLRSYFKVTGWGA